MNTKIVYVLTSTEKDVYLEQTMVSICSLRHHNPDAIVDLVVDHGTAASMTGARAEIKTYITNLVEVDTPEGFNNMKNSRYLKTNLRSIIKGDFLYVDGDTIIARPLDDIDNIEGELCAVADKHVPIRFHQSKEYAMKQLSQTGVKVNMDDFYVNGGVMLVRDTPKAREFYAEWYTKWVENCKLGIFTDQPPLAYADAKCGHPIRLIDGTWNCQVNENGVKYLHDAYIIHYFASNVRKNSKGPYLLMDKDVYVDVKNSGKITPDIEKIINHPWNAFSVVCPIINEYDAGFLHSSVRKLCFTSDKIYRIVNAFCDFLYIIIRHLSRGKNK